MTIPTANRRRFLRELGIGASAAPFLSGLSLSGVLSSGVLSSGVLSSGTRSAGLARGSELADPPTPKRLVIFFSPNGTLPDEFWPDQYGSEQPLQLKPMLAALEPFRDSTLMLKGVHNQVRGDGDNHMRGMSCLLTGCELNPGNIQGGSHTPAGWGSGISIDQELRRHFQAHEWTKTRFGSLEFGVAVPNRADPWTRMCYAGDQLPIAPIGDPQQMFKKLYGGGQEQQVLSSVLDDVAEDLKRVSARLNHQDQALLERHMQCVRQLELDIEAGQRQNELTHPEPEIDPEIELVNDNAPAVSRMQIDLLVNTLANDMTRIATLQYMRSVGQARMRWLDIEEGHHSLSHEPDDNKSAHDQLKRINAWFAGELAYLARRLRETPEPTDAGGTMLDHTQIVWVNELGKGNSHTLNNLPLVLIGGGAGFQTNCAMNLEGVTHNRLWLALAHALGHHGLETFGAKRFCEGGPLKLA